MNNEQGRGKINAVSCSTCVHHSVCCYKEDFLDVCNAVLNANVNKREGDRKVSIKNVMNYDFLDEIVIKCKHYHKETPTPRYQDSIRTLTNPCDISTSTSTSIPRSSLETTADYIFG